MIKLIKADKEINFFTSDQHIGHKNIARYADRPFNNSYNTNQMDEILIHHWNSTVAPNDNVLVLGDVALGTLEVSLNKWARCHGSKFLVPGNHDRVSSVESPHRIAKFKSLYEEAGFIILDEIVELITSNNKTILASHYPYIGDSQHVSRYDHLRPVNKGLPLVHGHTHSHEATSEKYPKQYHVGVDAHSFIPVESKVIENWVEEIT